MKKKLIKRIPVSGSGMDLDMTDYKYLLEQPEMERLNWVQQVPFAESLYVGCKHTRMEHSLGVYHYASRLAEKLEMSDSDAAAFKVAALLHDIGHPAFSHVTEPLLGEDHKYKSAEKMKNMEFINMLADPETVEKIITEKDFYLSRPLTSILGADKLDYVERDLYHCGLGGQGISEGIITHAEFRGEPEKEDYGILYEGGNAVTNFLKTWWSAHQSVYLTKNVEIPRTMLQRAIYFSMDVNDREKLFDMHDREVMTMIDQSSDEAARRLANNLKIGKHHVPVLTFKLDGYERYHNRGPEEIKPITVTQGESKYIQDNIDWLVDKESKLAERFSVPKGSIFVTPSQDVGRMDPDKPYCVIFMGDETLTPLKEAYPDFSNYLREESKRHYAASLVVEEGQKSAVLSQLNQGKPKYLFFSE